MAVNFILITFVLFIFSIGIFYVITNKESYIIQPNFYLAIFVFFFLEIIFSTFFTYFLDSNLKNDVKVLFFKVALLSNFIIIGLLSSIHSYVLLETNLKYLPSLIYSFMGGLILSVLINIDSINILISNDSYSIEYQDFLMDLIIFYHIIYFVITLLVQFFKYKNISYKKVGYTLNTIIIILAIKVIIFLIYLLTSSELLRIIYSFIYVCYLLIIIYVIFFQFDLFIVLTNKIYNFIIFHRSGILLFAYDFKRKKEIEDSILKGSILIGINHILTNFGTQRDNLNLIKMKDRDIILNYDKNHAYAILLTTDHKNKIIDRSVKLFMKKFTEENNEILHKINQINLLIDLSEFKNIKKLLFQYFGPYIKNA